jgi:hypothetical protein
VREIGKAYQRVLYPVSVFTSVVNIGIYDYARLQFQFDRIVFNASTVLLL